MNFERDLAPHGNPAGQPVSPALSESEHKGHSVVFQQPFETANCLTRRMHKGINTTVDEGQTPVVAFKPSHYTRGKDGAPSEVTPPLSADADKGDQDPVVFAQNTRDEVREMPVAGALSAQPGMKQQSYIRESMQVRRLTPIECERLQGFPDNYTRIPWRGKDPEDCPDGPRYKALGNSMAVPVMHWIGRRIHNFNQQFIRTGSYQEPPGE